MLDNLNNKFYIMNTMSKKTDYEMVKRFIEECARLGLSVEEMGARVGRSKGWASMLINGKISRPHWRTRNLISRFLGEL